MTSNLRRSAADSGRLAVSMGLAFATGAALVLFSAGAARSSTPAGSNPFDRPVRGVTVGQAPPAARFTDQTGRRVSLADWRGRTIILAFIYTHCTDQCPLITAKFARLSGMLPHDRVRLVEVSIDPSRDTPRVIADFAHDHEVDSSIWSIVTGDPGETDIFARSLGVSVVAGARGELLHDERSFILGPDGKLAAVIDQATWTPEQMAAEAQRVAGLPSNALTRLDLALGKTVAAICGGALPGRAGLADAVAVVAILIAGGIAALLIARKLFAG